MQAAKKALEKMGADEVAALAEATQEREDILNNIDKLHTQVQDPDTLKKSIERGKRILEKDEALIPRNGIERDLIVKEIKKLEDMIVADMPSKREMNAKLGDDDSDRYVQKNMWFHKKHNNNLLRLKDLKRRLEPDDPFAGDLERIRPK